MTRTTHPITAAAARVKVAQVKADQADAAVARLNDARVRAEDAHAALNVARAELRALLGGDVAEATADVRPADAREGV